MTAYDKIHEVLLDLPSFGPGSIYHGHIKEDQAACRCVVMGNTLQIQHENRDLAEYVLEKCVDMLQSSALVWDGRKTHNTLTNMHSFSCGIFRKKDAEGI